MMRKTFFNRWLAIGIPAAFLTGFATDYFFAHLYASSTPLHSYHLIAGSIALFLAGLAVLLVKLPTSAQFADRCPWLAAWGQTALLGLAAFLGMAVAPVHAEPLRTFLALAVLFLAQTAVFTALHALLTTWLFPSELLARQLVLLCVGALVTALLWSRGVIVAIEQSSPENGRLRAEALADAAMKLSPPLAVCAAWYIESDAGINLTSARFDLIHSPLTYREWLGITGKQVAYPDILPPALRPKSLEYERHAPGLAAVLLLWGLPLIVLCDVLLKKRRKPQP